MVVAIEPKYLRALRTSGTNKLNKTIPEILTHLFVTYVDVTPADLLDLTSRVENLNFPSAEPVDTIFSEIDDLAAIAEIAGAPISATQKINIAYIHFQKFHIFKSSLNKWNEKDNTEKTWPNFKVHLRTAHKSLQRTGALTIEETLDRTEAMNMVTDGVVQAFQHIQPPRLEETQSNTVTTNNTNATLTVEPPPLETYNNQSQSINATTVSELTVQTFQRQMDMLQAMMKQMQCMPINPATNTRTFRRGRRNQHSATVPRNPNQCRYCWTHGLCSHFGRNCRSKAEGHQDEATTDNCMGGSVRKIPLAEQ